MENTEIEVLESKSLAPADHFAQFKQQADEWMAKAKTIKVTDATQVTEIKQAREFRLELKKLRGAIEKKRLELVEDTKKYTKAVDSAAKQLKDLIEPIEEQLEEQEKFAERAEAARKEKLRIERAELLKPYTDPSFYDLANMPEEKFQSLLDGEKKAEADRIEAERVAKQQQEELELKQKQFADRQKELAEYKVYIDAHNGNFNLTINTTEEEFEGMIFQSNQYKSSWETKQAEIAAENEKLQQEAAESAAKIKEQQEAADKAKAEAEAKIKAEQADKAKLEAELKARDEADARAKAEAQAKIDADKKAAEEAAKKAAQAPDKDKLRAFYKEINAFSVPEVSTPAAKVIVLDFSVKLKQILTELAEKAKTL